MNQLSRIADPKYVPSTMDILHIRHPTSGVIETCLAMNGAPFRIVDVGGQRSERRKWISCFQDVTAVLFVIAISEYQTSVDVVEIIPSVDVLDASLIVIESCCCC